MIDGTGFFLVGNMINGSFTSVVDSGLSLSRVGIFRVDGNGYLVDNQRNYLYGYALKPDTGIPEKPATKGQYSVKGAGVDIQPDADNGGFTVTIGGVSINTKKENFEDQVKDWIEKVVKTGEAVDGGDNPFANYSVSLTNFQAPAKDPDGNDIPGTVNIKITAKESGNDDAGYAILSDEARWGDPLTDADGNEIKRFATVIEGGDRIAGVEAEYSDELSTLRIPIDPDTGEQYEIQSYKINEDGTIVGVDNMNRTIAIGQIALVTLENPNGLEKTDGYYYSIGPNTGNVTAIKPNGGPAGKIMGNYLEMANVDLANEFSQMITTQRGYQANSKIITVTDQMLEELVNMKR